MKIGLIIIVAALVTACISGVFGMAGGLIFMGVIATFLGVAEAMVVHGAVQSVSNGYRAFLLKEGVRWDILGWQLLGALPAISLMLLASITLNKAQFFCSGSREAGYKVMPRNRPMRPFAAQW